MLLLLEPVSRNTVHQTAIKDGLEVVVLGGGYQLELDDVYAIFFTVGLVDCLTGHVVHDILVDHATIGNDRAAVLIELHDIRDFGVLFDLDDTNLNIRLVASVPFIQLGVAVVVIPLVGDIGFGGFPISRTKRFDIVRVFARFVLNSNVDIVIVFRFYALTELVHLDLNSQLGTIPTLERKHRGIVLVVIGHGVVAIDDVRSLGPRISESSIGICVLGTLIQPRLNIHGRRVVFDGIGRLVALVHILVELLDSYSLGGAVERHFVDSPAKDVSATLGLYRSKQVVVPAVEQGKILCRGISLSAIGLEVDGRRNGAATICLGGKLGSSCSCKSYGSLLITSGLLVVSSCLPIGNRLLVRGFLVSHSLTFRLSLLDNGLELVHLLGKRIDWR